MSKFEMMYPIEWDKEKEAISQCTRKFTNMRIEGFTSFICSPSSLEYVKMISQNIKELKLHYVEFDSNETFYDLLKSLPNLKMLLTQNITCKSYGNAIDPVSSTIYLDLLILSCFDSNLLSSERIQSQKILLYSHYEDDPKLIGKFLAEQENLKTFGVKTYGIDHRVRLFQAFASNDNQNKINKLESLAITFDEEHPREEGDVESMEDVLKFIEQNRNTLKAFEMNLDWNSIPNEIYKELIQNFNLKKLNINANSFPSGIPNLIPNVYLKTLILKSYDFDPETLDFLFKSYPSVEDLYINIANEGISLEIDEEYDRREIQLPSEVLILIEKNLKSLRNLRIYCELPNDLKISIPTLRGFTTKTRRNNLESLKNFIQSNKLIETIVLDCALRPINHEELDQLTKNLPNLKRLFINQHKLEVDKNMLQMLSNNCENLERFRVRTFKYEDEYDEEEGSHRNYDLTHYGSMIFEYVDHDDVIEEYFKNDVLDTFWFRC